MQRMQVPVVDLTWGRDRSARAIDAACRTSGFFGIVGHGVDRTVLDRLFAETYRFFDQPPAVKAAVPRPGAGLQRGYTRVGGEVQSLAHGEPAPADLSEHFASSRFPDTNVWPDDPAFVAAWEEAFVALDALAVRVIRLCALALGLDEGFFDGKVDRSPGTMRANHYPAVAAAPPEGTRRGGAHTDYGSVTLLRTDGVPGLEVVDGDGGWHPVPAVPDGFVVNVGDLLARWTNDRWRSTWHRVVLPPGGPPWPRRLSVAFFQTPNPDTVVSCLPTCCSDERPAAYEPVVAGDWVDAKIRSIYVGSTP
jgi:isopenicillin N synthase-like dioxygenase